MVNLNEIRIDPAVLHMIPKRSALELSVLPISETSGFVFVAVPEIFSKQLLVNVQFILGTKKVKLVPVSRENIVKAIHRFYSARLRATST